ncbi:alpha/beta fold hydrolase [Flavitalea antarctica]
MKNSSYTDLHHTAQTNFIDVDGIAIAYRRFGRPTGTPLVLLQHFTGTMDNWDPAVTNGLSKSFEIILFDNNGVGSSSGETPRTIQEMADDTIKFFKALNLDSINLLGLSMGGFVAQEIALKEPALVNKLILVGAGPKSGVGISGIVNLIADSEAFSPDEQKLYFFYETTNSSRALGEESLKRINKRTIDRDPETSSIAVQAQLASILDWAAPDPDAMNQLRQIKHPVWIVNGSNDIVVPTINSYTLFKYLPNAKLSLYPDSGHGSLFQYP